MSYKMSQVCELTGINAATLRNWEQRYSILNPRRTQGGQRVYSQENLELLKEIQRRLAQGERISEIAEELKRPQKSRDTSLQGTTADLLKQLANYDLHSAQKTYARIEKQVPGDQLVTAVFHPILKAVGDGWRDSLYSIAQEHFVTGFIRMKAFALLTRPQEQMNGARKVVLATLEGEWHEGGLLLTALLCKQRGYEVIYLGASTPIADLKDVNKRLSPSALCLSFSYRLPSENELRKLSRMPLPVAIGGRALQGHVAHPFPKNIHCLNGTDWEKLFKVIDQTNGSR